MSKTFGLVVELLEELGEIPDLKNMTMLPWENVISYSKLFTSEKMVSNLFGIIGE